MEGVAFSLEKTRAWGPLGACERGGSGSEGEPGVKALLPGNGADGLSRPARVGGPVGTGEEQGFQQE